MHPFEYAPAFAAGHVWNERSLFLMLSFSRPSAVTSPGTAWALIVIGALAVLAGIVAILFPGLTLLNLIIIFGWFAIIAGVIEVIHAFTGDRSGEGRVILALWGIATIIAGLFALLLPGITLGAFILLIAAYFIVTGIVQIVASFRGHLHGWLLAWGVIGVIAGIVALVYPSAAALTIAIVFGVYAILGGISAIGAGIHALRSDHQTTAVPHSHLRAS
jgi:uncharacterized membrane protein HdeD (DUF308 family)